MDRLEFETVTRGQGNNQALKDGLVRPRIFDFKFQEVNPLVQAFRRMVRGLEFDICEMALTTYVCAKEHGVRFTALPIFLVRGFHHGAIVYNVKSGIRSPKQLEGCRVGVSRGYTVTTGVWARSIMQEEYDVDLSKITWVLSGDEHVTTYQSPENVIPIEEGRTLEEMLASGELAAAVNFQMEHPDIQPLIPSASEAAFEAMQKRGFYPINHLIVVRDELLQAHPWLAAEVFHAFAESKHLYLERLKAGKIENPTQIDALHLRVLEITNDPLPYGLEPNRQVLEKLIQCSLAQRILQTSVNLEALFAPGTLGLTG